jgi:hypothetical protein
MIDDSFICGGFHDMAVVSSGTKIARLLTSKRAAYRYGKRNEVRKNSSTCDWRANAAPIHRNI